MRKQTKISPTELPLGFDYDEGHAEEEVLNVARQKASGVWTSKMGKGHDIDHPTLAALEGATMGTVVKIMKRRCKDGRRTLE